MPELTFKEQILEEFRKKFVKIEHAYVDSWEIPHPEVEVIAISTPEEYEIFISQALDRQRDEFMAGIESENLPLATAEWSDRDIEVYNMALNDLKIYLKKAKLI